MAGAGAIYPRAKRVHGVKGFDAAYKACARDSQSSRFFTIDGDNKILPAFLELNLDYSAIPESAVLSWPAKNSVNGLCYGNGGIKNWPKDLVQNMRTHESADSKEGAVDFCFQLPYLQMPEILSEAEIHGSPYQAFRAGFREGAKMCLERGLHPDFSGKGIGKSLARHIWHENLSRLKIWCGVGADVENGLWSMYGARLGCKMLCLSDWDHQLIRDYDWFRYFWEEKLMPDFANASPDLLRQKLMEVLLSLERELNEELDLGITGLNETSSRFFKSVYINPPRTGFMFK